MIKEAIVKIVNKEDLSYEEAYTVMNEIMSRRDYTYPECGISGSSFYKKCQSRDDR